MLFLTMFFLKESVEQNEDSRNSKPVTNNKCCALFSASNIKDSFLVLKRKREGNLRLYILTMVFVMVTYETCRNGDNEFTVLFVTRSPLNWKAAWYGYYHAVQHASTGCAVIIILPILINKFHLSDFVNLFVGIIGLTIKLIWTGFSTVTWIVFVAAIIGSCEGLIPIAVQSLLSKLVDFHEVGKMFSILGSFVTLSKFLGVVIFPNVYSTTASVFKGISYLTEASIYIILLVSLVIMFWKYRVKLERYTEKDTPQQEINIHVISKSAR